MNREYSILILVIFSRHLPTARIVPSSGPIVPPSTFAERVTPFLFEFSRLLSIVPAIFGTMYNIYYILYPPTASNTRPPPERIDYFLSALWAILTGFQCLRLATGLLTRWRLYYDPLSTLVRLLALQGICWPATHLTLSILEHEKRPVICWAIIGTTTCMSRSVQIWVTSNLWWEKREGGVKPEPAPGVENTNSPLTSSPSLANVTGHVVSAETAQGRRRAYWKRWGGGGKWGGRRWDWKEVSIKCVLPAGILYFVMAWTELLRREFSSPAYSMPTPDLPIELWLKILTYLPRSALHKMIGLNRLLFELALNDLYEEVRFISDDKNMRKAFDQLSKPAFLPAVDDSNQIRSTLRAIIGIKGTISGSTFDLATRAVKSCPNLNQVTLIVHDHAIVPEFKRFLGTLWAQESIQRVAIDTTVAKIPILLQPIEMAHNLTEFDINISVSRFPATPTECHFASKALVAMMIAFKSNLTALTFSSLVPMEFEELFESFPRLLKLRKFEFLVVFNVQTIPNAEGLTRFVARHSTTLETLILRPHARQVSLAISDHSYSIWLDHKPLQKPSRVYSLTQISLPNLRTFDVGIREPSPTTSALPPISRFAPSLTKLVVSNAKLSQNQLLLLLDGAAKPGTSCSLEDFSFESYDLTSTLFDTLAEGIPSLKRLEISYTSLTGPSTYEHVLNPLGKSESVSPDCRHFAEEN
ncbi:hypothetical protein D9619_008773 [Psilocybe cf. subviscida]|uniref:F-box domain-containing protein n=1 Tax=Psilocybe cf. subviscida TaxID=2480587 RepID=A0A8H5F0L4_9AGAR|nr:hypothetical protein D9619_008773 [Psilocybe cf. subviscida]